MAVINLATNHAEQIGKRYVRKSVVADISLPSSNIKFDGSKTVVVSTPRTVALGHYQRTGTSRYGAVVDAGNDIQAFTVGFDEAWTAAFDKGNKTDSTAIKKAAAEFMNLQMDERVVPFIDKMALYRIAHEAGIVSEAAAAPTAATILEMISQADVAMSNALVPTENRTLVMGWSMYHNVRLNEKILAVDKLGEDAIRKGDCGSLFGMNVRCVPDSYLPSGVYFMILQRDAAFIAQKIKEAKVHLDPPGISGDLFEGRIYCDAFVREEKSAGVYVYVESGKQFAQPEASVTGTSCVISNVPGDCIALYTLDGSDPRYSATAMTYSAAVTAASGDTFRCCFRPVRAANETPETLFTSAVTDAEVVG